MLVISRKVGERIRIGDDITVVVLDVTPTKVRFGIEAPQTTPVHREELWRRIQGEESRRQLRPDTRRAPADVSQLATAGASLNVRRSKAQTMDLLPPIHEIAAAIKEELNSITKAVVTVEDDESRLLVRAVLPDVCEPRPKDVIHRGIAARTNAGEIHVQQYLFRQVCCNGAIMPQAVWGQRIQRVGLAAPTEAIDTVKSELRQAVRQAATSDVFSTVAKQMQLATNVRADRAMRMLMALPLLAQESPLQLPARIRREFHRAGDRSLYGLMNAVTATARKTPEPELRWRLEQLGGAVLSEIPTPVLIAGNAKRLACV